MKKEYNDLFQLTEEEYNAFIDSLEVEAVIKSSNNLEEAYKLLNALNERDK